MLLKPLLLQSNNRFLIILPYLLYLVNSLSRKVVSVFDKSLQNGLEKRQKYYFLYQ